MCRFFLVLTLLSGLLVPANRVAAQAKGKKYALVIGITEYKHASFPSLKYTENDIDGLAVLLRKPSAGFEKVRAMTTGQGKKDEKDIPNAGNIQKALDELVAGKNRDDTVLIALAGHGVQLEVEDKDGKGKPKPYSYFCPSDADLNGISYSTGRSKTLLLVDDLFASLAKCGASTKLVLIDACRNDLKTKATTRNIDPGEISIPRGVAALFSCGPGQRAWETPKLGGKGHGVFFHFILEGMRGEARNDDGEVTWNRLADYVQREVTRGVPKLIGDGAKQSPHNLTNVVGESAVLMKLAAKERPKDNSPKDVDKTKTPIVDLVKLYKKGLSHAEGRGEKHDWAEAARCFRKAADGGHDLSKAALAYHLVRGYGVKRDDTEAQKLARQSFAFVKFQAEKEKDKADGDAQAIVGRMYLFGLGTTRDESQALAWFAKGSANGSSLAMLECGLLLTIGRPGRPAKEKEAFGWFVRAGNKGNADALYLVGQYQAEGKAGNKKNVPLAIASLKKAAARDHREAKELLKKLEK